MGWRITPVSPRRKRISAVGSLSSVEACELSASELVNELILKNAKKNWA
jgi:hypothetical protein